MSYEIAGLGQASRWQQVTGGHYRRLGAKMVTARMKAPSAVKSLIARRVAQHATAFAKQRAMWEQPLARDYQLDGLGFSVKPPKWVRKMKPGKVLKKAIGIVAPITRLVTQKSFGQALKSIAMPSGEKAALVGAALTIPGVAPFAGKLALGLGKNLWQGGKAFTSILSKLQAPSAAQEPTTPMEAVTQAVTQAIMPQTQAAYFPPDTGAALPMPSFAEPAAAASETPATPATAAAGGIPMPLIVGGVILGAMLLSQTRKRG
jgi:hypothetical protein